MADSLGALFLKAAQGPTRYAGTCIMGRQVLAGLRELAPDSLWGALRRGVETVAREAGVSVADVERFLPLAELRQLLDSLAQDQQAAVRAWEEHAGHIGGLLEGVTDLTQDGRPPDVSLCLERLALKVQADRAWSRPLRALSRSSFRYGELLLHCRELLDTGGALEGARRRRRLGRVLLITSVAAVTAIGAAAAIWLFVYVRAARTRVAAGLGEADPCAVERLAARDLELAAADQQAAVARRRELCTEQRAERQAAAERERQRQEQAAAKAKREAEREERCRDLGQSVEKGKIDGASAAHAGKSAVLLERVATGKLEAADLGPSAPALPCEGTAGGRAIREAFARAVLASTGAWLTAEDLSDPVQTILAEHAAELQPRAKLLFGLHAETQAQRALVRGEQDAVARALRLCSVKRALEVVRGPYCDALSQAAPPSR